MSFILTTILFLLLIAFLLWVLSMIWPPDSPWAPWWQTKKETARKMCQLAGINKSDIIYDLGCGTGTALLVANEEFGASGVGIEIDILRVCTARLRVFLSSLRVPLSGTKQSRSSFPSHPSIPSRLKILRKNFFSINISPATVIFVYLIPKALARLVPKFTKELKSGTRIVSYIYPMPVELFKGKLELVKYDIKDRIFVYKII